MDNSQENMMGGNMDRQEFEMQLGKAKVLQSVEVERQDFWMGYARGLRRGYFGEKFGTDDEHTKWWGLADDEDNSRQQRGEGYRAGIRRVKFGDQYCHKNFFRCESCSLMNSGRDCHNNPILE